MQILIGEDVKIHERYFWEDLFVEIDCSLTFEVPVPGGRVQSREVGVEPLGGRVGGAGAAVVARSSKVKVKGGHGLTSSPCPRPGPGRCPPRRCSPGCSSRRSCASGQWRGRWCGRSAVRIPVTRRLYTHFCGDILPKNVQVSSPEPGWER